MGDGALAFEVLGLFVLQANGCTLALRGSPDDPAAQLHKLKGSARGIGAWAVADAAAALENSLAEAGDPAAALSVLVERIEAACCVIQRRLSDAGAAHVDSL